MGKKRSLLPTTRAQIVALSKFGMSQREIARKMCISRHGVQLAIQKHARFSTFKDARRSGRPRKTTTHDVRIIKRYAQKFPTISLPKLSEMVKENGINVSTSTLSRRLSKEIGLKSYRPAKKPRITPAMAKKRYDFAKRHQHWTESDWKKVMWSDETIVQQFGTRPIQVRRPPGQRFNSRYVVPTVKHCPSQMVWGAISSQGRACMSFLPKNTTMNGQRYLEVLKSKLEMHMDIHNTEIFMQDGAPCHRSKMVTSWLRSKGIDVLEWPGNSPDCNPIENVWKILKDKVAAKQPTAANLIQCIKEVWCSEITEEYCQELIASMPKRMAAIIDARGYFTKY